MKTEEWRTVGDFPRYEVSNVGRIRSFCGKDPLIIKTKVFKCGYVYAPLYSHGKMKQCRVHRLVLAAFVGPCPPNMNANHINGNTIDNRIENLEWVTHQRNTAHAIEAGLYTPYYKDPNGKAPMQGKHHSEKTKRFMSVSRKGKYVGENNHVSKLKEGEVWLIKKLSMAGISHVRIAPMFKVSRALISLISEGKRWAHVAV